MSQLVFSSSHEPTIGIEIELALVDAETMELRSGSQQILQRIPERFKGKIKPELMQCYIEANSDKCRTVAEAEIDLREKLCAIQSIADDLGLRLYWSGTHPFSSWRDQVVTPDNRYKSLINLLQDTARQLVTFGMHVHVGVESGDKAVMLCDRIMRHLPVLLALSCNSPFWEGRVTGVSSWRSRVMDGLPTAGLPPLLRNWSEYVWLVNHLVETGYIETIRELWWDVRPHHNFGTIEVRICDVPGSFEDVLAIAALIHSLVQYLSAEIDQGIYQHDYHPFMIRENKWQAARYGLNAKLVDSNTYELQPAREVVEHVVDALRPIARELDCSTYLERVLVLAGSPTWSERQVKLFHEVNDPVELVRRMTDASRVREVAPASGS